MSRKPKYRAWLKDEKKMVDVISINTNDEVIAYIDKEKCDLVLNASYDRIELMEYSYLEDNNYTEIYEGDIVELLTEVEEYGVVKFEDGAFYVEADGFRVNFYDNIRGGDVIVVGNIYEHKNMEEWYE